MYSAPARVIPTFAYAKAMEAMRCDRAARRAEALRAGAESDIARVTLAAARAAEAAARGPRSRGVLYRRVAGALEQLA